MKILVSLHVYNELPYLEPFIKYYQNEGCDFCFIDNYSTDGTYEYLVENNFKVRRVDTNGSFNIPILQKELSNFVHEIKPDWIIYTGVDMYFIPSKSIKEIIIDAENINNNQISLIHVRAFNTGEQYKLPLQNTYFYIKDWGRIDPMISKYYDNLSFLADRIVINDKNILYDAGIHINYGDCKLSHERNNSLKRVIKAWNNGMNSNWCNHYITGNEKNWIWNKEDLIDIRTTEYYNLIEKIL